MADQTPPRRLHRFEDLDTASDETLRQIAARVHIVDLAYAFGNADPALRERLLGVVRPGLADQIRSANLTVERDGARFQQDDQVRSARARVVQVVQEAMLDQS
jgi:hypothetical protein